ncbi:MAG: hypothetical protein EPN48_11730 [Microbacteriaceae bacterium]|nr:MAG: hypothetical protein EPN48_11730 [Microbacteriaceae bacterium]
MVSTEYLGKVRTRDPLSSWEAASKQTTQRVDLVKVTIRALLAQYGPMTDESLNDHYEAYRFMHASVPNVSEQSVRTRRKALQLEGLVRDTGRFGVTRRGNKAALWEAAE